jgi:hypothetical protein
LKSRCCAWSNWRPRFRERAGAGSANQIAAAYDPFLAVITTARPKAGVTEFWVVAFATPKAGWLVGTDGRISKIIFSKPGNLTQKIGKQSVISSEVERSREIT